MQLRPRERAVTQQAVAIRRSTRITEDKVRYTSLAGDFDGADESELSEFSSSPTPPPELASLYSNDQVTKLPLYPNTSVPFRPRASNGRFILTRSRKRAAIPTDDEDLKEPKRQRQDSFLEDDNTPKFAVSVESSESEKPIEDVELLDYVDVIDRTQHPHLFKSTACPLGLFSLAPREVRDMIYGHAVKIEEPVRPRGCCGMNSTARERKSCAKHGKVIKDSGRFNLLFVSKQMAEEAGWLLHNLGKLELPIDKSTAPYLRDYVPKTRCRLGELPGEKRAKVMWLAAAQFRTVEISFCRDAPRDMETAGVTNIVNGCSLLLKARQDVDTKAYSAHSVTVNLGSLFEDVVPFGPVDLLFVDPDELLIWAMNTYYSQEDYVGELEDLADNAGNALKKLVSLVKQHRGCSQWTFTAGQNLDVDRMDAKHWLPILKSDCEKGGMEFLET